MLRTTLALSQITVRHIMVPINDFIAAPDETSALALLSTFKDIDQIPIPADGQPTHIFERGVQHVRLIDKEMLISDSTSIIALPHLFSPMTQFFFVIEGQTIIGLVHVSDLNSSTCKIPYFCIG